MGKTRYAYSPALGRHVAVGSVIPTKHQPKRKRKPFKVNWVKLPAWWVEVLRGASGPARLLAMEILIEAFKREHIKGNIVLSSEVTKIPQTTRRRAAKELVELGLIAIEQIGNRAPVVTGINKRQGATRGVQGATHGAQGATGGM
jgi:hypothetical protein